MTLRPLHPTRALAALACSVCLWGSVAYAGPPADREPATGNTSAPSDWRFAPGQTIGGVPGLLDGVARLAFTNSQGVWVCSGSLLSGGQYVLTAAHCADNFTSMSVNFGWYHGAAGVTRSVAVGDAFVHPGWNGTLDNGSDIAIVKLNAPVTGISGYALSTTNDVGKTHLMAGYGTTSTGGATTKPDWGDEGYGHYGYNTFDVTSKGFNDAWDGSGSNLYGETYISDFDNGLALNNTLQRVADLRGKLWTSSIGLGATEALIAAGDSGGGDFVWNGSEWLLSGVHSWGWQFCGGRISPTCDVSTGNSSSYGDLSGSTAVFSHLGFIASVTAVPEPANLALLLGGLLAVLRVVRRRQAA